MEQREDSDSISSNFNSTYHGWYFHHKVDGCFLEWTVSPQIHNQRIFCIFTVPRTQLTTEVISIKNVFF